MKAQAQTLYDILKAAGHPVNGFGHNFYEIVIYLTAPVDNLPSNYQGTPVRYKVIGNVVAA